MTRRHFVQGLGAAVSATAAGAAPGDVPIEECTAADLGAALAAGRTTSRALVEAFAARIESIDRAGPALRSVIELNPDAMAIAEARDRERRDGRLRGPLHGLPILIKDNIATADRMETSAGSPALLGARVPRDAALVTRLRDGGAVLLGKNNLSEWANFRGTHSTSGWSTRGGQTRNPYALDRSPSGSSSGTAVSIAASLAWAGIGTETDGSITSPSSCNGLVGIKPTVGLVSREGIVPISTTQDTAGPMARIVADAALLLAAIADPPKGRIDIAALTKLDEKSLRGARLGVVDNLVGDHVGTVKLFDETKRLLRDAGAVLVAAPLPHLDKVGPAELDILLYEMKPAMARWLAEYAPGVKHRSLADLIAFNRANPQTLALFGQEYFEQSAGKGSLNDPAYAKAVTAARRWTRTYGIDLTMRRHRVRALIAPTCGPAWLVDPIHGDAANIASATSPAAVAGYPHVTVPMGQVGGLPVGLSFFGGAWSEAVLVNLATAFEQIAKARRAPTYRASAGSG